MPLFHFIATPMLADDKSLINKDIYLSVIAPNCEDAQSQIHPILSQQNIKASFVIHIQASDMTKEQFKQSLAVLGYRKTEIPQEIINEIEHLL